MPDYKEIRHERLYVKVPGGEKVRKTAEGRMKRLLADGWRETDRSQETDYIQVRLERTGHRPPMMLIPAPVPQQGRTRRDSFGGPGRGPGGGGGGGRGPGGPRGPRDSAPPQAAPAAAPVAAPAEAAPAEAPPAES